MRFSQRLRELMSDYNASAEEIADYMGIPQKSVGMYASGTHTPSLYRLLSLADFFGLTVSELLEGVDE